MKYLLIFLISIAAFGQPFAPIPISNNINSTNSIPPIVGTAWVTGQSLGTLRNNFSGDIGVSFTPSANDTITSLGIWVVSGNSQSHTIYLIDATACTVLASVSVNCSGATPNQYLYGSITPVAVTSGHGYIIAFQVFSGGDQWYDDNTSITTTAFAVGGTPIFVSPDPPAGNCSAAGSPGNSYGPVNFLHSTPP